MPAVYILCPDDNTPIGGIMKLYEVAEILNRHGIESIIVHESEGFQITWFEHSVKVTDSLNANINQADLIILPEIWADKVLTLWPGIKKIIFNQNIFNTFQPFHSNQAKLREAYCHKDIAEVMVVSNHDLDAMRWLFPEVKVSKFCLGINSELFYYNSKKQKQIAFMSRRGRGDYSFITDIVKTKGLGERFTIKVIDQMSLQECANVLRESAIFLSFNYNEGFGLPPAEAMACGCIVIGYHGQGGKEYFKGDVCFPIEQADYFSFARQLSAVIENFNTNPLRMQRIGKKASQFILKRYSMENQSHSILKIIEKYL